MPLPMVVATAVPNVNAATKLKKAAHTTATRGDSTRVDTTVAIEFAASWNPLRKSKARATTTMTMAKRWVEFMNIREVQHDTGGSTLCAGSGWRRQAAFRTTDS